MKNKLIKLFSVALLLTAFAVNGNAQRVFVSVRPAAPVIVHPAQPSPRHIWIEGEYVWRGNNYIYQPGYWTVPPPRYRVWHPGYWRQTRGGWYWVPGSWRR
ncbi:YXWGXW repeat-containing protein [Deminuibacter soli]|uniref:YXWGXW repeat-containing protein n=1 Tax=Deminuibacter soli TaxID=2291815 RepID=A0A3E1NPB9_9BACT|nr:YXWGXW repeat-containing protein [Deminuibacter soli]RFM29760.1 hypothetical protein DXN05_01925 [Deminuibacter soli]